MSVYYINIIQFYEFFLVPEKLFDLFYEEILSLNFTFPASFKVTFPIRYCGLSDDELFRAKVSFIFHSARTFWKELCIFAQFFTKYQ